MRDTQSEYDISTKQPLFNNAQMIYKGNLLLVKKWIKAVIIFVSDMVSGNAWKSIQDIRKGIANYAGLQFDYRVNNQWDEKGIERYDAKCHKSHYRGRKKLKGKKQHHNRR